MITKACPRCRQEFELTSENFHRNRRTVSGFVVYCKPCQLAINREFFHRSGGRAEYNYLSRYGITLAEVEQKLAEQDGRCAICGNPIALSDKTTNVDHDHLTNIVRGILCSPCNRGLGAFRDDVDRLMSAAAYLMAQRDILGGISVAGGQ